MKNTNHLVSLIIPAYRQEKTIGKDLLRIKNVMDTLRYEYEVIVIVDGNIDSTYARAKRLASTHFRIFVNEENKGKSYTIRQGMAQARGDIVGFIDSGMEIDPNGISMLLEHMEWYNADIIVGSKRHSASLVHYSITRRILSYGYYFLVKLLFRVKIQDTQAGIKFFKRDVLTQALPLLVENKFAGDLEMLVVAKNLGFNRIYEAPIKLDYKLGKMTSAATWYSIRDIFIDTCAIFYRSNILHAYSKSRKKTKN